MLYWVHAVYLHSNMVGIHSDHVRLGGVTLESIKR